MAKSNLRLVTPVTENCTVEKRRPKNADLRTREHLTDAEVERLIETVKANQYGYRDALMVPPGLPARPQSVRSGRPSLGAGPPRRRNPDRPQGQERYACHASVDGPDSAGIAAPSKGQRQITLRSSVNVARRCRRRASPG